MKKTTFLLLMLVFTLPLMSNAQYTFLELEEINAAQNSKEFAEAKETIFSNISERPSVMASIIPTAGATENFNVIDGDFFYDPSDGTNGGPGGVCTGTGSGDPGDYPNCNCTTITTLTAANLSVTFLSFNVFGNFDYLNIYDGPNTSFPKIYDSNTDSNADTYAGMITLVGNPPVFTATSGSLTFEFLATSVVNSCGWEAEINISSSCAIPTNTILDAVTPNSADFSWTASPTETNGYTWVLMNAGDDPDVDTPVQTGTTATGVIATNLTNLNPETDYDFYVMADCGTDGTSAWSAVLNFTTPTACLAPTDVMVSNVSDSTADFSWTASPDETNGYEWKIFNSGDNPDTDTPVQTGTTATGVPNVSVTNLNSVTVYDFYVAADCSTDGKSRLSDSVSFETECAVYSTFPFVEDFEATSASLGCWSQVQEVGQGEWTFVEGAQGGAVTTANSGTQNARFVSLPLQASGVPDPITKLVSPILDISSLSAPKLTFYHAQEIYTGDFNELKVYYRANISDSWTELAYFDSNVDSWTQEILSLPNPSSTYQIAFEGINYFGWANVIDDVVIDSNISTVSETFKDFNFYPNPSSEILNLTSKENISTVEVYNILGQKLINVKPDLADYKINVSNLNTGTYFMKVVIQGNSKIYKFIKK